MRMPMGTILFFVVIALGLVGFVFVFKHGAGPDWMWRGGRRDPVRNAIFRADGSWRRYGRAGLLVAIAILIACSLAGL